MKLYVFPVAPNPTKVRLYLAEKAAQGTNIPLEEVTVSLANGEQRSAEHLARNPLGTLPVLELDDGTFVCESLAIIEYVEERFPEPSLFGDTPEARALGRQLERRADLGVLVPVAMIVHSSRSPLGYPANEKVAAYARERLETRLGHLDRALADGRPFLAGDRVTVADCSMAAGLQFGRFRGFEFLDAFEHVRRWDAHYRARPEVAGILVR